MWWTLFGSSVLWVLWRIFEVKPVRNTLKIEGISLRIVVFGDSVEDIVQTCTFIDSRISKAPNIYKYVRFAREPKALPLPEWRLWTSQHIETEFELKYTAGTVGDPLPLLQTIVQNSQLTGVQGRISTKLPTEPSLQELILGAQHAFSVYDQVLWSDLRGTVLPQRTYCIRRIGDSPNSIFRYVPTAVAIIPLQRCTSWKEYFVRITNMCVRTAKLPLHLRICKFGIMIGTWLVISSGVVEYDWKIRLICAVYIHKLTLMPIFSGFLIATLLPVIWTATIVVMVWSLFRK